MRHLERVNKELLLVFSMFVIALLLNFLIDAQRMVLYIYTLPTVASAYIYGRRHATLTAFASVLLVTLLTMTSGHFQHVISRGAGHHRARSGGVGWQSYRDRVSDGNALRAQE